MCHNKIDCSMVVVAVVRRPSSPLLMQCVGTRQNILLIFRLNEQWVVSNQLLSATTTSDIFRNVKEKKSIITSYHGVKKMTNDDRSMDGSILFDCRCEFSAKWTMGWREKKMLLNRIRMSHMLPSITNPSLIIIQKRFFMCLTCSVSIWYCCCFDRLTKRKWQWQWKWKWRKNWMNFVLFVCSGISVHSKCCKILLSMNRLFPHYGFKFELIPHSCTIWEFLSFYFLIVSNAKLRCALKCNQVRTEYLCKWLRIPATEQRKRGGRGQTRWNW